MQCSALQCSVKLVMKGDVVLLTARATATVTPDHHIDDSFVHDQGPQTLDGRKVARHRTFTN